MTEVVIDSENGNKRRLPIWMLRVNASNESRKSENGDGLCSSSKENRTTQATGSKMKPLSRKLDRKLIQETDSKESTLQTSEAKQKIRKSSRRSKGLSNSSNSYGEAKDNLNKETAGGERKAYETAAPKKSNRLKNSKMKVVFPERNDDELELTVEDLMSIAEEYVNADREKQPFAGESTLGTNLSSLSVSSEADISGPIQGTGLSQILSKCTKSSWSSKLTETEGRTKESLSMESLATNITGTGDTAQDMLNLFLGPLLNKPPAKEQDLKSIGTEGLTLAYESNRQVRSTAAPKEEESLVKRKSSLKDKVAMFLD